MATLNKPYCTLAQLQEKLGNDSSDEDEWFQECINRASRWIDEHCHRDFWFHDHSSTLLTVERRWVTADSIFLPWPVITLTAITVDDNAEVLDQDWRFEVGRKEIVYAGTKWPEHKIEDWIVLTGTFGYSITGLTAPPDDAAFPAGITHECIKIAAAISGKYRKEFVDLAGVKHSLLDDKIPKDVKMNLGRYRRHFL